MDRSQGGTGEQCFRVRVDRLEIALEDIEGRWGLEGEVNSIGRAGLSRKFVIGRLTGRSRKRNYSIRLIEELPDCSKRQTSGARVITPLTLFDRRDGLLTVDEVVGHDGSARRLGELGLCEGRSLSVVRGGDPAIVEVDGSRLALSRDLQSRIFVRPRS